MLAGQDRLAAVLRGVWRVSVNESRDFYELVARYYDAENAHWTDDLPFYAEVAAETGGPILDVGSGTGRVLFYLARQGHHVWGFETSPQMLARARCRLEKLPALQDRVTMLEGDVLGVALEERFALITISYHTFMHLRTQEEQIAALRRCGEWLRPGGRLVIDLPDVGALFATPDDGSIVLERTFVDPESGRTVMQQSVSDLDRADQLMHITWIYDELDGDGVVRRLVAPLTLHYYFPAEMRLLLRLAGLREVAFYGDYDFGPFADGCPRMIVVAEKGD